jgi:hypothetical protein
MPTRGGFPTASQPAADRDRFQRAAADFLAAQQLNADRPESRATAGNFLARRAFLSETEADYEAAIPLSPHFAPDVINLADLAGRARCRKASSSCERRSRHRRRMAGFIIMRSVSGARAVETSR